MESIPRLNSVASLCTTILFTRDWDICSCQITDKGAGYIHVVQNVRKIKSRKKM